jgi:hypothetical protein
MELETDDYRASLFLLLSWVLKVIIFSHRECQRSEQESHVREEPLVIDSRRSEFIRTNLSASPFLVRFYRCPIVRYLESDRRESKSIRSISGEHET